MRLLLGTFVITYNLEHVVLLVLCWAAMAWFELSPDSRKLDQDGGPHSMKSHLHIAGLRPDGSARWPYVIAKSVLGLLLGLLARYMLKRTYSPSELVGGLRLHDSWVISSLIVVTLVLVIGLFGYEDVIKLQAREDSELFPIGRVHALLIGIAIYAMAYMVHSQCLNWNWFNLNAPHSSGIAVGGDAKRLVQKQSLADEEKTIGLWLLAQGSIYASLIVLDILLVQSTRLSLMLLALLAVFLTVMFVFKKVGELW